MSIKRDVNGYKVFELPNGEQLLWAEEDRVMFIRSSENGTPLTMDPDNEFEDMLVALEYASVERDRLRKQLEAAIYALNYIQMGEWERTHDFQDLEVWTTRRINPPEIVREALSAIMDSEVK